MHLDAYARVSKLGERSVENLLSTDEQRDKIATYAKLHNIKITWHEDEIDVSGGSMDRPIFNEIMERVRAGQTDGIIVAKLVRFARTLVGGVKVLAELAERKAVLVSVAEGIDLSTPHGRAMGQIMIVFAELERERRKGDWEDGQRSKIARGIHGASPIYGYVKVNGQPLTVDTETAPNVKLMFQKRAEGWSPGRIAKLLDDKAPLASGRRWTSRKVSQILGNRAYLGHAYYGGIENRDAHPAIITRDEYEAAQVAGPGKNALKNEQGRLTGIIRCAGCRYVMRPRVEARGERKIPGYVCAKHHANGECPEPTAIAAHLIDEAVLLTGMFMTQDDTDNGLEDARRVLTMAEDRMRDFLANDELREIVGESAYMDEARDRRAAVDAAQSTVDDLLRHRKPAAPPGHMSVDEIMDFHRSLLDSVYVRKGNGPVEERVLVFDKGDDNLDKPRRGNKTYSPTPVPWDEEHLLVNWAKEPEIWVDGERVA